MYRIQGLCKRILHLLYAFTGRVSLRLYRAKNRNKCITIISRDCLGGVVYHQLGVEFRSPTINLCFSLDDFNLFCLHLEQYLFGTFAAVHSEKYPIGLLKPRENDGLPAIKVHFLHYSSFDDAVAKWGERAQRVDFNNLFVVSSACYPTLTSSINSNIISDWNAIPYRKVIFVDRGYGFQNEFIIAKPNNCDDDYPWLLYSPSKWQTWRRVMNAFDFPAFLQRKL